jgi:hypothetical protein
MDGVIYRYDVGNEEQELWTRAKQVPADRIVAYLEGNWMKEIRYKLQGEKVSLTLSPSCFRTPMSRVSANDRNRSLTIASRRSGGPCSTSISSRSSPSL